MSLKHFIFAAFLLCVTTRAPAQPFEREYVVIVNSENPVRSVDRKFLHAVFLKKTIQWSHGEPIEPVDLPQNSLARGRFSEEVLNRSVAAVKSYWQQMIFSGRNVPPPELNSDAAVVRYVLQHKNAIGYVSPNASLVGVKILIVR